MSDVTVDDKDITLLMVALGMATLSLVLLIVTLVVALDSSHKVDQNSRQIAIIYNAECTYRNNLQQQVTDTEHYLSLHPDGAPALGITSAQLNSTLAREKAAVDSLSALNCPQGG